jgi:hypothetical protein
MMMKQTSLQLGAVDPKVSIAFLRRIGAPQWRLLAGASERVFGEKSQDKMISWIADMQRDGHPVYALLPRHDEDHWWLTARLPLSVPPAMLRPAPQIVVGADCFDCLWRLEKPIATERAQELVFAIVGKAGKSATGEPIPLPGTILQKRPMIGLARRYPVRQFNTSPSPGYRVADGKLVDVQRVTSPKADPRLMSVPLAENAAWQPGGQSNGFLLVLGASGSGKTESLKTIGAGIHRYGVPVLVLDFHGDVMLNGVASTLLSAGPASTLGLNPLELDVHGAQESGLYDQRVALREMIRRAVPALGHRQADTLGLALDEVHARAGIRDDAPDTWSRAAPTFTDLLAVLGEMNEDGTQAAGGVMAAVRDLFGHPIFQRAQHLSVDAMLAKSARLDLSKLPDGVRFIAAESLLRRIFRVLRMRGPIPVKPVDDGERFRLFVIVDEAKILSLGNGERDRSILSDLFTEARKFGLGMVLASQMAEHFCDEVRSNSASWLVLKPQAMAEAKRNAPNIGVEPDDLMKLRGRGDGYFRTGADTARRIQVRPVA